MVTIKQLEQFTLEDKASLGFNGFKTNRTYIVEKREYNDEVIISIKIKDVDNLYIKEWSSNEESHTFFQNVLREGLSFGAYINEHLVGILIVSEIKWNNSLWIENILISQEYRGKGIGEALLSKLMILASEKNIRIIGLETQNTNYPAIQFYKKHGFEIDGVDFSLYPSKTQEKPDVAIIMKKKID
jgi:ribosomal protein S18 acetylase RimI-like enzyme